MIEIIIISLFYLIIGSIEDLKKHEVYDFLNFSYFFIMFIIFFVNFVFGKFSNNLLSVLINIFFIILFSVIMYVFNQWGGGDAKLMFGLAIAISFLNVKYYDFLFNLIIAGGFYSIFSLLYYIIKNFNKIKDKLFSIKKVYFIVGSFDLIALLLFFFNNNSMLRYFAILFIFFSFMFFLIYVAKVSEDYLFKKEVKASMLTEGDWVINSISFKDKVLYNPKKENGISLASIKEVSKLVEEGKMEDSFIIKSGIAYFPAILIAFIISIFGYSFFNYFIKLIL